MQAGGRTRRLPWHGAGPRTVVGCSLPLSPVSGSSFKPIAYPLFVRASSAKSVSADGADEPVRRASQPSSLIVAACSSQPALALALAFAILQPVIASALRDAPRGLDELRLTRPRPPTITSTTITSLLVSVCPTLAHPNHLQASPSRRRFGPLAPWENQHDHLSQLAHVSVPSTHPQVPSICASAFVPLRTIQQVRTSVFASRPFQTTRFAR